MKQILKDLVGKTIFTCNDMGSAIQERKIVAVKESERFGTLPNYPSPWADAPEIFMDYGENIQLSCKILINLNNEFELDRQHSFTLQGIRDKSDQIYLHYDKRYRKPYFRYEGQKDE